MADRTLGLNGATYSKVLGRIAEQDREQGRLSGAVSPDESDLLAVTDGERHGIQDASSAYLDTQISDDQHLAPRRLMGVNEPASKMKRATECHLAKTHTPILPENASYDTMKT
jgi:hypothetical protein